MIDCEKCSHYCVCDCNVYKSERCCFYEQKRPYGEWKEVTKYERFVDQLKNGIDKVNLKYSAGEVRSRDNDRIVAFSQSGAEETFSIGQPVFDQNGNLLGFLGIGLYANLDYSCDVKTPVEYWQICLPTQDCFDGKKIFTYWQMKELEGVERSDL